MGFADIIGRLMGGIGAGQPAPSVGGGLSSMLQQLVQQNQPQPQAPAPEQYGARFGATPDNPMATHDMGMGTGAPKQLQGAQADLQPAPGYLPYQPDVPSHAPNAPRQLPAFSPMSRLLQGATQPRGPGSQFQMPGPPQGFPQPGRPMPPMQQQNMPNIAQMLAQMGGKFPLMDPNMFMRNAQGAQGATGRTPPQGTPFPQDTGGIRGTLGGFGGSITDLIRNRVRDTTGRTPPPSRPPLRTAPLWGVERNDPRLINADPSYIPGTPPPPNPPLRTAPFGGGMQKETEGGMQLDPSYIPGENSLTRRYIDPATGRTSLVY